MKKFFKTSMAILVGLSLTLTACKKDDSSEENKNNGGNAGTVVPQEQKSTVIYFGGTWCPPCGAYGKPAKEQIKAQTAGKAVIISAQVGNDPMTNADANSLIGIFNPSGVPAMYIGANEDPFVAMIGGSTSTGTTAIGHVNTQAAKKAKVNAVLSVKEVDGILVCTAEGKFFEDVTGEYFISGYLLEDKLDYAQSSDASVEKNIHYNVLRAKFGTSITGETLGSDLKKDATFKKELNFFIQPTFKKENLAVVACIWKKGASGFTMSNSSYIHFK